MSLFCLLRGRHHGRCHVRRGSREVFLTTFLRNRSGFFATAWAVFPFRLLRCSVLWGGRRCLWRQNPSSPATRWPTVTFCCSRVQRFYGMSMCSMCYSVRQTKTLFLRREGLRLQAASLAQSSSNLWCGGVSSGGCSRRRRRRRSGDPHLGYIVFFLFSEGAFVKVAM